jgi:xanthine dehydrogenase YagR molybdenum-binding subunit
MSATTSRQTPYGYVIGAGIAKGRILSIDSAAARALPGVLAVVTAENAGILGKGSTNAAPLLGGPEVAHYHQAIGLVVRGIVRTGSGGGRPRQGHLRSRRGLL